MKKVILITNIPNPYRVPLFEVLNEMLREAGWELLVVFGGSTYSRRKFSLSDTPFKFRNIVLESSPVQMGKDVEKTTFTYKGISKVIRDENPEVIIVNGFSPATLRVWFYSFTGKFKYLIWSGAILKTGRYDSFLRKLQRKIMVGRAAGFIAYGTLAAEYLKYLGAKPEKISIGINTVDTAFFKQETQRQRSLVKQDDRKHLIFVGYLVPRKNIMQLLVCIRYLSTKRNDFVLDILGDGSDRIRLEKYVKDLGLQDFVSFYGFVQREKLPEYFSKGCCFLFQTGFDIWGLVLNEAMAAGLPVISSVNAGATLDLVEDGKTGYRVDFNDVEKVGDCISQLLDNPSKAADMGEKASLFIENKASLKASATGFVRAILSA